MVFVFKKRCNQPIDAMKIPAILIIMVIAVFLPVVPLVQAANSASLGGIQVLPKDNIWNTPVDTLPVDARSTNYVATVGGARSLYYYFGFPYNVVTSAQAKQKFTTLNAYSDNVAYPVPSNPLVEDECADRHMLIIDKDSRILYELYNAQKGSNGLWTASSGSVWSLSDNKFRKNNATPMWSADAAGLPIFPGLLRYDEVSSGEITHALRVTVPSMRGDYIWPARASSPLGKITDQKYPPAGQRFRLKASFDISGYPPQAKVILTALKKYGMIVADNGGAWALSGVPDTRWNTDDIYSVYNSVQGSDFEAVDESSLMIDKNSAQARQPGRTTTSSPVATPKPAPASSITVTSPNSGETWQRGTSRTITWDYTGSPGSTVEIVLMKAGAEAGTIASSVSVGSSGHGSYTWPIYATGSTGSDFKVSVQSISQPAIKDTGNNYFTITPGSSASTPVRQTEIGVYGRDWHLDTNGNGKWDGPAIDTTFSFGTPGDIPLAGDWNGNGISDIGVFRPSSGNWYLDYNPSGVVDTTFHFGTTGDIPLAGDWNGNGISDAAVFRPSTGNWYLNYNKDGVVNKAFHFGTRGDIPVSGDWNGDGTSDVGVFRPSTGNWYLTTTRSGTADSVFHFGKTGDNPITGDWDGDGTSDVGVFRPSTGHWYLNYGTQGVVDKAFQFGSPEDIPVVGVWN
jgi:hypothetical protein